MPPFFVCKRGAGRATGPSFSTAPAALYVLNSNRYRLNGLYGHGCEGLRWCFNIQLIVEWISTNHSAREVTRFYAFNWVSIAGNSAPQGLNTI